MSAKALLKSAREALGAQNYSQARDSCQQILEADENNYNALVFLGLAEQNLNNVNASEKAYRKAIGVNAATILAYQGLANLYEKVDNTTELAETLEILKGMYMDGKEAKKCLDTIQKLIQLYERTNHRHKLIGTLRALTPESNYSQVLAGTDCSPPIETWRRIANVQEKADELTTAREIQNRRQRLGADPLEVIKEKVEQEVVLASQLEEAYEKIINLEREQGADVSGVMEKLLVFLQRKLRHVSPDDKQILMTKLHTHARYSVDHALKVPLAYEILLESQNTAAGEYDLSLIGGANQLGESTYIGLIASGYLKWKDGADLNDILEDLIAGVDTNSSTLIGYHVLASVYVEHGEYESAVDCANKAKSNAFIRMERLSEALDRVLLSIDLCLARANLYLGAPGLQVSLGIYKNILGQDPNHVDALHGLGLALAESKKYDESIRCFEKVLRLSPDSHSIKADVGWVHFLQGQYESALDLLRQALEGKQEASYIYRIGRVYWAMGDEYRTDKQYVQMHLLQAAKLNPRFGPAFTYMGHYYAKVEQDRVRALKCYQRAVSLAVTDAEAAQALCKLYLEDHQISSAKKVLKAYVSASPRTVWAHKQLGTIALVVNDYIEAIGHFQTVLRLDTKDVLSWEGLGEAYGYEGKYQAALKAFARAIELEERSIYSHYQMALLTFKLRLYAEAAEMFRHTNQLAVSAADNQVHMPSLKGLCDSLLALSAECYQKGAYGESLQSLNEALKKLVDAGVVTRNVQSMTKLLADICLSYRQFVPARVDLADMVSIGALLPQLDAEIARLGMREIEDTASPVTGTVVDVNLDQILACAIRAYRLSIGLCSAAGTKESKDLAAGYWHDMGLAYFYRWELRRAGTGGLDSTGGDQLLALAVRCARIALGTHPGNDIYWNALGVYTLDSDPKISQHSFIRAIECNSRNAAPWSNLGYLYLILGDLDLANQAFGKAQFVDPDWSVAWLGQAYIAEKLGSSEAFELFEHAHELGGEAEFEIDYSYAIQRYRRALSHGHRDAALYSTAAVCLLKFVERRRDDPAALNLLGLVLERQGQFPRAVEAFDGAMAALTRSTKVNHEQVSQLRKVLENRARALCAAGQYTESAATYARMAELGGSDALALVGSGIALYFDGRLQESLLSFEGALQAVGGQAGQSYLQQDVMLLLSQVLYALGSDQHVDLAKQQLFQCIATDPQYVKALVGLCALGLVRDDGTLAQSAAAELVKVTSSEVDDMDADVDWILSRLFLAQGNLKTARGFLAKAIHRYPWKAERWAALSEFINKHTPSLSKSSVLCVQSASSLPTVDRKDVNSSTALAAQVAQSHGLALLSAGKVSANGRRRLCPDDARRQARAALQKAIRISPSSSDAWIALGFQLRGEIAGRDRRASSEERCSAVERLAQQACVIADGEGTGSSVRRSVAGREICQKKLALRKAWASILEADTLVVKARHVGERGDSEYALNLLKRAIGLAETAAKEQPSTKVRAGAYATVGKALKVTGDIAGAVQALKNSAVAGGSAWISLWEELAETYAAHGFYGAASLSYRQSIANCPPDSSLKVPALLRLARLALHLSDAALANEAINEALKLDPGSVAGRCLQAIMMLRSGGEKGAAKALKVLAQAGVEGEEDRTPWLNWVLYLAHKTRGDAAVARSHLEKELDLQPSSKYLASLVKS
ncbi:Tetratricopeptide repeat protein 37 [Rhizophlyctis rosea]|nr:Tetratricopeptide repeat protein 37 [Rhizophlyctis rosea]